MIISETKIRVRYAETDKMGFVYYGNYATYYEVGRTEALRQLGSSYDALEKSGVGMPIYSLAINYKRPAYYDDLLTVKTTISEMPMSRINFHYEIYNQKGDLVNYGETVLVFINLNSGKSCRPPEWFLQFFKPYFNS